MNIGPAVIDTIARVVVDRAPAAARAPRSDSGVAAVVHWYSGGFFRQDERRRECRIGVEYLDESAKPPAGGGCYPAGCWVDAPKTGGWSVGWK